MWSDAARASSLQVRGGAPGGGGGIAGASAAQAQMGLQGARAAQAAQAAAGGRRGKGGGRGGRGGAQGGRNGGSDVNPMRTAHQAAVNAVPRNMGMAPDPASLVKQYFGVAASATAKPAASPLDKWVPEMNYGR